MDGRSQAEVWPDTWRTQCPTPGPRGDMGSCLSTPLVGVSRWLHNGTHFALEVTVGTHHMQETSNTGQFQGCPVDAGGSKKAGVHGAASLP